MDVLGSLNRAYRAAAEANAEIETPGKGQASPVVANIYIETGGAIRMVQFLRCTPGVLTAELVELAVPFESGGQTYYIADPIALLAGKLHNLISLDQHGRNDLKHLEMLNICVPIFLARQLKAIEKNGAPAKDLLRHLERVLAIPLSDTGRKVSREMPLYWSTFLPLKEINGTSHHQVERFRDQRLWRWAEHLLRGGLTP